MDQIPDTLARSKVARAIEEHLIWQFTSVVGQSQWVEIHDEPDMIWSVSKVPHRYLNCVLWAELTQRTIDRRIEDVLTQFKSRRLPVAWRVGPSTRPVDLARALLAHGLASAGGTSGMAADLASLNLDSPPPPGLIVKPVADEAALADWLRVVGISFQYPEPVQNVLLDAHRRAGFGPALPWRLYAGLLEGEVVAAARIFLSGGAAVVSHVATLPQARRRGIGTAMALGALREAQRSGCSVAVLHAAETALGIYRRMGLRGTVSLKCMSGQARKSILNLRRLKCESRNVMGREVCWRARPRRGNWGPTRCSG
jgi:ribosomal protein S18 acetylase RimI-like enzyme